MTATDFFNAALKHRKLFEVASDMVDIVLVADSMMSDYAYDMSAISGTLGELYQKYTKNPESLINLNELDAASDKAFTELEKIMKEAAATAEGEYVDSDRLEKEAKKNGWSESEKSEAFWADAQMDWDWFIENLAEEYWLDLQDAFKKDENLTWDRTDEVPRILKRTEEELRREQESYFNNEGVQEYINQNSDIHIDFDKDNVKLLVVQHAFEGYD